MFVVMLGFGFISNIMPTYYSTWAETTGSITKTLASVVITVQNCVAIVSAFVVGSIIDRMKNRKVMFTWAMLAMAVLYIFPFRLTVTPIILIWCAVIDVFMCCTVSTLFSIVPEMMHSPAETGYGMAMLTIGQNIGMVAGPALFSTMVEIVGWANASLSLVPFLVIGAIAGFCVTLPKRK